MTDKRPWTEARLNVWYSEHDGKWAVTPEIPAGENFALRIATFTSEADARLFAASPEMYEALEVARDAINDLMPTLGEENRRELNDSELSALDAMLHIHAALRAANPSAFGEGETATDE